MKVPLPYRVNADIECINQITDSDNVLFKQIPIALGYSLISPKGNQYLDKFGTNCRNWFVDQMLQLQQTCGEYFKQSIVIQISLKNKNNSSKVVSAGCVKNHFIK